MALESEKSFPFDSLLVNGVYDRRYVADDFARYFRTFISSGMFMKEADNLQVIANGDMSVTLRPGKIIIDGYRYDNIADIVIPLSPADGVLNRVDRISLTWDKNSRDIHYTLQEGTPSYNAVPAECRRTAEYLDYVTADINVAAGAISISQADIVDQRLNTAVCGLAIPFSEIDTKTLYKQIQSDLDRFRTVTQADILQWFEGIKDILDENAIINMQNQIGTLGGLQTQTKESLVAAINELANREIDVLDTAEAIKANTRSGKVAGAKGTKELFEGVSERLAWKEKGTVTGAGAVIPLPDSYNELKIVCYKDNYSILNITLPKNEVTAAVKTYYNSFYNDMKNQYYMVVEYSLSGIRLIKAFWGTNIASSVVTKLYYR